MAAAEAARGAEVGGGDAEGCSDRGYLLGGCRLRGRAGARDAGQCWLCLPREGAAASEGRRGWGCGGRKMKGWGRVMMLLTGHRHKGRGWRSQRGCEWGVADIGK